MNIINNYLNAKPDGLKSANERADGRLCVESDLQQKKKKREFSYLFLNGVCSKLYGEDIEDLLSNPTTFGARRERTVVR